MANAFTTLEQTTTINFYANLNYIATMDYNLRRQNFKYFGYKAEVDELYTIFSPGDIYWNNDDYFIAYPVRQSSNNPIYLCLAGTHTTDQFYLSYTTLGQDNKDYDEIEQFTKLKQLIDDIRSSELDNTLFNGNQRPLILTGFSLGATKSIYLYYEKRKSTDGTILIDKCVVFNPFMGKFDTNSGFSSTDPYLLLNPWHKRRIDELISLHGENIGNKWTSLNVNYVSGEFASKYWQSSRDFIVPNGHSEKLSLSWGKNFKKPAGLNLYEDSPPDYDSWIAEHEPSGELKGHAIRNWMDNTIQSQDIDLYLTGNDISIHSVSTFKFEIIDHEVTFKWLQIGNTPQLGTILPNSNIDPFLFDFVALSFNGNVRMTSQNTGAVLEYQFEKVSTDMYDVPIYIIKNTFGKVAKLNRATITADYLSQGAQREPAHLSIVWSSRATYDSLGDGSTAQLNYHFQLGSKAELYGNNLVGEQVHNMRRVIDSSLILPNHFYSEIKNIASSQFIAGYDSLGYDSYVIGPNNDKSVYSFTEDKFNEGNASLNVETPALNSPTPDEFKWEFTKQSQSDLWTITNTEQGHIFTDMVIQFTNEYDNITKTQKCYIGYFQDLAGTFGDLQYWNTSSQGDWGLLQYSPTPDEFVLTTIEGI